MALESQEEKSEHQNIAQEVRLLAEALSNTHRLVALTGAGISTESGIPDYRSPNGLWSKQAPIYYSDFVRNSAVRRRYWARSLNGYRRFRDAQPNTGHRALALMEKAGRLHYLITQNVDRLHTKAGSQRVVELHGENSTVHCIECDYREPRTQTQERLEWENRHLRLPADEIGDAEEIKAPICPVCGGLVKPGVVFFGEPVPADLTSKAFDMVEEAGALLIVGSSLTVWSGYRLARAAREQGKPLYILNIGPTRADEEATLKVEAPAGETLQVIAEEMGIYITT
ncbi:MAG: NAD-dependent protein deacetylase [Chloroflexia bacterium]